MKKTNKTQYTILGMLAIRPMSGYEIQHLMKQSTSYFWQESAGQIYPTLTKLLKEKLIIYRGENLNGKRRSKIYALTPKGLNTLKEWLPQKAHPRPYRDEILLKLFFGKNMSLAQTNNLILKRKHDQEERIQELLTIKKNLEQQSSKQADYPYWIFTLEHGLYILRAESAWCEATLTQLKKLATEK